MEHIQEESQKNKRYKRKKLLWVQKRKKYDKMEKENNKSFWIQSINVPKV